MKNILLKFKDRKYVIYSLTALLILQIIVFILLKVFSFQSIKLRSVGQDLIKGFNKDKVISLIFSDSKDTFSIDKIDSKWFVKIKGKNIPGDKEKIDLYFDILKYLSSGIIRDKGEDQEIAKKYGLNAESVQKLTIVSPGKEDYILYIGDTGEKSGTCYISINNEKIIREVNSIIAAETNNNPINWSERRVFQETIDTKDIQTCEISANLDWFKESYIIKYQRQKDSENFILVPDPGKKLQPEVLQNLLKNLIELKIDDYVLKSDISIKEKLATIKLITKNGKLSTLDFYKAVPNDNAQYIIDMDFNDYLYLIDEAKIKQVLIPVNELLEIKGDENNKNKKTF